MRFALILSPIRMSRADERFEGGAKWPRLLVVLALALLAVALLGACAPRDKSRLFSPFAKALIGTTSPSLLVFASSDEPPAPVAAPEGWSLVLSLARFGELEDGTPTLAVLMMVDTEPGASMDLWLSGDGGVIARWAGGVTTRYRGDTCFQLALASEDGAQSLALAGTTGHQLTVAFRDEAGAVIVSGTRGITSNAPQLSGTEPRGSDVFRDLYACP